MSIAQYSFLPWLRRGIANQIEQPATAARAVLDVAVVINSNAAHTVHKKVNLIGPGDIIGINHQMVVRTEPRQGVDNFEPNYLAFVELYDEDFPWRYTPDTVKANNRLPAWLSLVVLKEGPGTNEFARDNSTRGPLPAINIKINRDEILPDPNEVWAWAHVHLNQEIAVDGNHVPNLDGLNALLNNNPDRGISRLLCPRRLEPNTSYHAFVIPTYEVGRKAGLGVEVKESDSATILSWSKGEAGEKKFPIYYDWAFQTGPSGDFEALVRRLQPRTLDEKVGIRDMDVQQPGFGMPVIHTKFNDEAADIVGLEGALKSPNTKSIPLSADSNFGLALEPIINLPADVQAGGAAEDPIVAPPLYGRWHALVERLDINDNNWINELNKDPRYRTPAGFGTLVIQKNQEDFMRKAWLQIGEVLAANRRIFLAQTAMHASRAIYLKDLTALAPAKTLQITAPVQRKILGSPVTIHQLVAESRLPQAALSGAFRKLLRPHGLPAKRFLPHPVTNVPQIVSQLNDGLITAAPPKVTAADSPTLENLLGTTAPRIPDWARNLLPYNLWILIVILSLLLLILVLTGGIVVLLVCLIASAAAVGGYIWTQRIKRTLEAFANLQPANLTKQAIEDIPPRSTFELAPAGEAPTAAVATGAADNAVAADYRKALLDYQRLMDFKAPAIPIRKPLSLLEIHATVMNEIHPERAFPKRVLPAIKFGLKPLEEIVPVMAYPDIKDAMYKPLTDLSKEFFVPNLGLIDPNTIALMVSNPRFIESYMVGLNHEFARELLWREYPTDQRPSSFRQFWEITTYAKKLNLPEKDRAEKLKDITKLHTWSRFSQLGEHKNRPELQSAAESEKDPDLVLVIRGDLLKRYPNTIIYAQQAKWGTKEQTKNQLVIYDETGQVIEDGEHIKYPIYKAHIDPDFYFLGFDLKEHEAKGQVTEDSEAERLRLGNKNLGWFFVIKEIPGEPRFGLSEGKDTDPSGANITLSTWNDLSWKNLGAVVKLISLASRNITVPSTGKPETDKNPEKVKWNHNATDNAFVLYRPPVLVAVHAREMLKNIV